MFSLLIFKAIMSYKFLVQLNTNKKADSKSQPFMVPRAGLEPARTKTPEGF